MLTLWRHHGHDTGRMSRPVRGRLTITLEKVIDVRAPLREVFATCGRVEHLPEILPHLREARPVAGDHHHWIMESESGSSIEWDTVVTRFGSNRVIAWETVPGSVLRHAGQFTLRPNSDGSTRIIVGLKYVLPPGQYGDRVAELVTGEELEGALRRWRARLEGQPASR